MSGFSRTSTVVNSLIKNKKTNIVRLFRAVGQKKRGRRGSFGRGGEDGGRDAAAEAEAGGACACAAGSVGGAGHERREARK